MMEFHVSRQARDRYEFDQALFTFNGNVIFSNFQGARVFAKKMNDQRDLLNFPEQAVRAGEINAMGLIDEILHAVVEQYRKERSPQAMAMALAWLKEQLGVNEVEQALLRFGAEFPPLEVYQGNIKLDDYLSASTQGRPNQEILLEEMLMLWIENKNPALSNFQELFDDRALSIESAYPHILGMLYTFFETQPHFGPDNQNLIDLLRAPALTFPHSLFAQLQYVIDRWSNLLESLLGEFMRRLTTSIDMIREENTQRGFTGPGPIEVPTYDARLRETEVEAFSQDTFWMPRLVLIAKNTFVWLDQLSQAYGRHITRLDEIPDEELEKMARWGFTGLWLIGLWERSRASANVKRLMGNSEAIASAYSLYDYRIADELGGEAAYQGLREKAWRYGIRLASDMVPNHMGIDSPWVVEHPDWFLSLDYSPFPSYSFNGPDLCEDSRTTVQIEDHYYDKTDAAVVFRHIDHRNGQTRFIYHGNDGTSMPWNDTAQLNYLKAEVREAVIQTILSVARRFPIIRFDAAMTLAKLHYQRLWFPAPGATGTIPSRTEFGMSKEQFDQIMPVEFWREVVDRVAVESPDTLLLAEAFWMMESYFVRTLGMHRVYNSAFMNILRDEDNAKYRKIMKTTLEFDPEILKRYVNFMNNPDERTTVDQFGKGDKYFGICMLMATLPGLPMFGHGQVEGYSEKYGMEFKRAYWNEQPDPWLIERHQREIFPVLHRRSLFSGVENFLLYDFYSENGGVNEDVYAHSNGLGGERALVVYHNRFGETQGWIRVSAGFSVKGEGGERHIIQRTLGEGLNLHDSPENYTIFRDQVTNLEYIRPSRDLIHNGLFLSLHAYTSHCFLDFREVIDDAQGSYRRINEFLSGRGAPSVLAALHELSLQPVLNPLREIINPGYLNYLSESSLSDTDAVLPAGLIDEAKEKMSGLIAGIAQISGGASMPPQNAKRLLDDLAYGLNLALALPSFADHYPMPGSTGFQKAAAYLSKGPGLAEESSADLLLFSHLFLGAIGRLGASLDYEITSAAWFEEWQFSGVLMDTARQMGIDEGASARLSRTLLLLFQQQRWFEYLGGKRPEEILEAWLANLDVQDYLQVHRFKDVLWFNKERFDAFLWWMTVLAVIDAASGPGASASAIVERLLLTHRLVEKIQAAEEQSEYQIVKLLQALQ